MEFTDDTLSAMKSRLEKPGCAALGADIVIGLIDEITALRQTVSGMENDVFEAGEYD